MPPELKFVPFLVPAPLACPAVDRHIASLFKVREIYNFVHLVNSVQSSYAKCSVAK